MGLTRRSPALGRRLTAWTLIVVGCGLVFYVIYGQHFDECLVITDYTQDLKEVKATEKYRIVRLEVWNPHLSVVRYKPIPMACGEKEPVEVIIPPLGWAEIEIPFSPDKRSYGPGQAEVGLMVRYENQIVPISRTVRYTITR